MRASATHSLPSPEHWPKRVPLVRAFFDEILEPLDDALHEVFFGVPFVDAQGSIELDVMTTRRDRVLASRHQGSPGLEGKGGGGPRRHPLAPQPKGVLARALRQG